MSHKKAILEGEEPQLGELLTIVANYLLTGMILQVGSHLPEILLLSIIYTPWNIASEALEILDGWKTT